METEYNWLEVAESDLLTSEILIGKKDILPAIKKHEDKCAALNEYLPKLRYPTGDKLTEDDARDCYGMAQEIYLETKNLLGN